MNLQTLPQDKIIGVRVTYSPLDRWLESQLSKIAGIGPLDTASGTLRLNGRESRDLFWPCTSRRQAEQIADGFVEPIGHHTQDGQIEVCTLAHHWEKKRDLIKAVSLR